MKLTELYRPKLGKNIVGAAKEYYANRNSPDALTFISNNEWLDEKLYTLGWEKLSEGAYSFVYENDKKNYILKVNFKQDLGYDQFVKLIHRRRNKHFPRISDKQQLSFASYNYNIYLIEKLIKIPEPYCQYYSSIISAIMRLYHEEMNPSLKMVLDYLQKNYFTKREFQKGKQFILSNPDLVKAAAILGTAQKYHKLYNDLHAKNIMKRDDGTIVIIDPYVG